MNKWCCFDKCRPKLRTQLTCVKITMWRSQVSLSPHLIPMQMQYSSVRKKSGEFQNCFSFKNLVSIWGIFWAACIIKVYQPRSSCRPLAHPIDVCQQTLTGWSLHDQPLTSAITQYYYHSWRSYMISFFLFKKVFYYMYVWLEDVRENLKWVWRWPTLGM